MIMEDLISRSPLRILENSIHGGLGKGNIGVLASRKGVGKTACLVHIATEASDPEELAQRLGGLLMDLGLRYGEPVLVSVVHLHGGRPGVHLESGVIAELGGIELVRVFYTCLGLEEAHAEHFLERPEPLAWLFATLMRPEKRTPEEHRRACLERIAAAPLDEERRTLLRRGAEALLAAEG